MSGLFLHGISRAVATATTFCPGGGSCDTGLPTAQATSGQLQSLMQVVFGVAGGIAVVMIVVGALRFVTAQGDPQGSAQARKILVFALVGLIISLLAEAIVTFVLKKL